MSDYEEPAAAPSEQLGAISRRVLIKTVLKCVLWFGLAWVITRIYPGSVWPWYVAWVFVAIGLAFSLIVLMVAFRSRYAESKN
ncbi:hypothetical protein IP90_02749 [Luteimonas cucumeris]|uniref:Uncharacterized protein n=1 Tax=Luteimonas cucumeris TaxID=985012 RepID=A0A562L0F9_9GAMM|nr:hypothetical protein IP90_02749 [Luteimonas cucumeris]